MINALHVINKTKQKIPNGLNALVVNKNGC